SAATTCPSPWPGRACGSRWPSPPSTGSRPPPSSTGPATPPGAPAPATAPDRPGPEVSARGLVELFHEEGDDRDGAAGVFPLVADRGVVDQAGGVGRDAELVGGRGGQGGRLDVVAVGGEAL